MKQWMWDFRKQRADCITNIQMRRLSLRSQPRSSAWRGRVVAEEVGDARSPARDSLHVHCERVR